MKRRRRLVGSGSTRWSSDGHSDLPQRTNWVYDHPFLMLLNVAVGGASPGNPDATTTFPQQMLVDYVRVYQEA